MNTIEILIAAYLMVGAFLGGVLIVNDSDWGFWLKCLVVTLTVALWLPFCIVFSFWKYIIKPVFGFFEVEFLWQWFVAKKRSEYVFEDNRRDLVRINQIAHKLELEAAKSKNPLKKLRAKLRSFCLNKINSLNGFVRREDDDYRVYLRGGSVMGEVHPNDRGKKYTY